MVTKGDFLFLFFFKGTVDECETFQDYDSSLQKKTQARQLGFSKKRVRSKDFHGFD